MHTPGEESTSAAAEEAEGRAQTDAAAAAPGRRYQRARLLPANAPPEVHHWRLHVWEEEGAPASSDAGRVADASANTASPSDTRQRSSVRFLFALRRCELQATMGEKLLAEWCSRGAVQLPVRTSLALSAAQWRLEGFRPACRPTHIARASGEAPATD